MSRIKWKVIYFRTWLSILFCCFLLTEVNAQDILSVDTVRLPIGQLTINDGLSQGFVKAIVQDHDGFMWFATRDGLNRYDGYHFTVFRHHPSDASSLAENFVTSLHVDSRGLLWIGFISGAINVLDTRTGKFTYFHALKSTSGLVGYVSNFTEDPAGNIWFGTSNVYVGKIKLIGKAPTSEETLFEKVAINVSDLLLQKFGVTLKGEFTITRGGNLWLLGMDSIIAFPSGISEQTKKFERWSTKSLTNLHGGFNSDIIAGQKDNSLYILNTAGIALIDAKEKSFNSYLSCHFSDFPASGQNCFDSYGNLWFVSAVPYCFNAKQNRLRIFLPDKSNEVLHAEKYRSHCIFIDRTGIIWLGTNGNGILKINPGTSAFHHFLPTTSTSSIRTLSANRDGSVIVNIYPHPPFLLQVENGIEKTSEIFESKSHTAEITSHIIQDTDGTYWSTSGGYGLYHYDPKTKITQQFMVDETGINNDNLFPLYIDLNNQLRIGNTSGGRASFLLFDRKQKRVVDSIVFPVQDVPDGIFISNIHETDGQFWFATQGGLFCFEKRERTWRRYVSSGPASLSSNHLLTICPDPMQPQHFLWIGTDGGGLNYFNIRTGETIQITEKDGLPNNVVYGILPDEDGNLWMSTNKGIAQYSPVTKTFISYVQSDGLQSNEFNRYAYCYARNAADKTAKGELFFGGVNGLNHFSPSAIKSDSIPPIINFTDLRIFNISEFQRYTASINNAADKIQLKFSQNMITIEFAAMDFTVPYKNRYQYKLEGFSDQWISNGTKNEVTFTNLNPGSYVFTVKASNNSGIWNEEGKSFQLIILPPWWMTWWARTALMLSLAAISYGIYRYRIRQLLTLQAMRNRIAGDLHDEIGSTLSSISIYSKVVQNRTKEKVPEAEPYLNRINTDIGAMMEAMSDIVWTINSSNDRFENIFSRMRSAAAELLEAKNYTLHFEFDETMNDLKLNMEQRKNFYLLFKEALNNIAKYALGNNVWIRLSKKQNNIEMLIRDDGKGFLLNEDNVRDGTRHGNGMNTMKARSEKLNGKLTIDSILDEGTSIRLRFPIA